MMWPKEAKRNKNEKIELARLSGARLTDPGKGNGEGNAETEPARSLEEINEAHIRGVDKFYRMYAGAASNLTGFHVGFIYLEIRVDDRLSSPLETIVRNIAKSWSGQKELSGAVGYCASIYRSARWTGFTLEPDATSRQTEEAINRMKEPENEPDGFVKIIEEDMAARIRRRRFSVMPPLGPARH